MSEEKKSQENKVSKSKTVAKAPVQNKAASATAKSVYGEKKRVFKGKGKRFSKNRRDKKDDFEQKIVDLARVTRVMGGGKRMRFRACVAVGDKKGKIGIGMAKSIDVTTAINKAATVARKNVITVTTVNDTIPHEVYLKQGAARILLKPARKGKGVIAGGAARMILELAGVKNITSKILGTSNKVNIARSVMTALEDMKKSPKVDKIENKTATSTSSVQGKDDSKKVNKKEKDQVKK